MSLATAHEVEMAHPATHELLLLAPSLIPLPQFRDR